MNKEKSPNIKVLNRLASKSIVEPIDSEFLEKSPEEKAKYLSSLASDLEIDPKEVDIKRLSEISADTLRGYFEKAFETGPEESPFPSDSRREDRF